MSAGSCRVRVSHGGEPGGSEKDGCFRPFLEPKQRLVLLPGPQSSRPLHVVVGPLQDPPGSLLPAEPGLTLDDDGGAVGLRHRCAAACGTFGCQQDVPVTVAGWTGYVHEQQEGSQYGPVSL